MVRLLMNTPAELTPTASTRGMCSAGGEQAFDWDYMANVFEHPFEVLLVDQVPAAKDSPKAMSRMASGWASTGTKASSLSQPVIRPFSST